MPLMAGPGAITTVLTLSSGRGFGLPSPTDCHEVRALMKL
jgi:small neutral amino acid transporter SnatA (MarC family)